MQIDKKNEVVVNVTANRIERYDTSKIANYSKIKDYGFFKPSSSETENTEEEVSTLATLDNLESWPTFEWLHVKYNSCFG